MGRVLNVVGAVIVVAVLVGIAPLIALAAGSYQDSVVGAEFYATSTDGRFAGKATGSLPGAWYINVVHTPLSGGSATITGGSFDLATKVNGSPALAEGSFTTGSVTQTGGTSGCTNQTYTVAGQLTQVGLAGSTRTGTGSFRGTLTHYRSSLFGSCVTYGASVTGTVSLSF